VGELAAPHAMSPPAISKHLRILEQAGLVARTIDGRVHHCQLDAHALENIDAWLAHYRGFWTDSLEALARHVEKA
jgi:DNA-binding transcriptional ArsR family regulator